MFEKLRKIFSAQQPKPHYQSTPDVTLAVSGFDAELTGDGNNYRLVVRSTGENADYPVGEERVVLFERSQNSTHGRTDNRLIFPKDSLLLNIRLTEKPYVSPAKMKGMILARLPSIPYPPHDVLTVEADIMVDGKVQSLMSGVELTVRKSMLDSPAWKAAEQSPHYMLDTIG